MDDLTTLASFKSYAGVGSNADDEMLGSLITAYSSAVRAYCNRDFTIQSYGRRFSGRNQIELLLPQYPIVSVDALMIDGRSITAQPVFGSTGFRFDDNAVTLDGYRFTRGASNIAVAWTAGYAQIPGAIGQAINEMVGLRYALRDKQGYASKTLAGETVAFITKAMPDSVRMVLDQFANKVPL